MGKNRRPLRPLGDRYDYSHLLHFVDDGAEFVKVDLADRTQKLKAETAPDYCGGYQHPLFIVVEPLQTAADDQPPVFWNVDLVDRDVSAELAGRIKDFPVFDKMPVHLLDEEWISLAFLKDEPHQTFRSLTLA